MTQPQEPRPAFSERDQEDARTRLQDAVALHQSGRHGEAENLCRDVLAAVPDHPDALHFLGLLRFEQGDAEEAIAAIRRAIEIRPEFAGFHFNLGNILVDTDRLDEAIEAYRKAAALTPDNAVIHNNLGNALFDSERVADAIDTFRQAIAADPNFAAAHVNLGRALLEIGKSQDAAVAFVRAIDLDGGLAAAQIGLGECRQVQGDFDAAEACFRRALEIAPDTVEALHYLLSMGRIGADDPFALSLQRLLDHTELSPKDRIAIHFALGKAYDDRDDFDRAFTHFESGNQLKYSETPYDLAEIEDLVARSRVVFTADFFAQRRALGDPSTVPVFIVGMPRSGTTLVEQIIASHADVRGAGELSIVSHIADRLPELAKTDAAYPEGVAGLGSKDVAELAGAYLDHLGDLDGAKRVTDKMPDNFRWLGLIALLFPHARIVHCRRHPLDNALSCYFQLFKREHAYAYDLAALGVYYRAYHDLMAHWREVLPVPIHDLVYEDLIADQEGVSRRLIEFCGLDWDPRCLDYYKQEREIRTASFWQARQPIYARSVGRWRHYTAHIDPLRTAFGDLIDR
ncbi:MAG: tetratricopeptide repeat protein [Alphaproteobacteria bacterium]|nr:tetratricopeptide repeat protein [Alphaproteobacteria bacterium]